MLKLLLGLLLLNTQVFAREARNIEILSSPLTGCYQGNDLDGHPVQGNIKFVEVSKAEQHQFIIEGARVDFILFSFHNLTKLKSLHTLMFEQGIFIDSRELNGLVSYKYIGEIERLFPVARFQNETLITVRISGNKYQFDIYQNDNREFLPDFYVGRMASRFHSFEMIKVSCK